MNLVNIKYRVCRTWRTVSLISHEYSIRREREGSRFAKTGPEETKPVMRNVGCVALCKLSRLKGAIKIVRIRGRRIPVIPVM